MASKPKLKAVPKPAPLPEIDDLEAAVPAIRDRILEFRRVPSSEIDDNDRNWRTHPEAQKRALTEILDSVGIAGAIVAYHSPRNGGRLTLIDGHERRSHDADWPTLILDVTDEEADLLLLTFDPISGLAGTDADSLRNLLESIDPGKSAILDMLSKLEAALPPDMRQPEEAAVDAPPAEPRSKRGEVYELGEHRLMCGDSTDPADVAILMAGAAAAIMVTDPPYGISVDHTWRDGLLQRVGDARTGLVENDDRYDWEAAYALTDAPVAYVWHSAIYAGEVKDGLAAAGYVIRQQIIWVKPVHVIGRSAYQWRHEPCWYAVRKGAKASWHGGRKQSTVWEAESPIMPIGRSSGSNADDPKTPHPTQKPISIFERPIANHTSRGDAVYEPFAGSGTALIAAERLGRRCYAMEIDPAYCDVIRDRYEQLHDAGG